MKSTNYVFNLHGEDEDEDVFDDSHDDEHYDYDSDSENDWAEAYLESAGVQVLDEF